jgi:hypothetical protein
MMALDRHEYNQGEQKLSGVRLYNVNQRPSQGTFSRPALSCCPALLPCLVLPALSCPALLEKCFALPCPAGQGRAGCRATGQPCHMMVFDRLQLGRTGQDSYHYQAVTLPGNDD